MSETGGNSGDGINVGVGDDNVGTEVSSSETSATESNETGSVITAGETTETVGTEVVAAPPTTEISINSNETTQGMNQILETPQTLEQAQKSVETFHTQSITQILENNGKYMSEADRARVAEGATSVKAVDYNGGPTGRYGFSNGKSSIEVSAVNPTQIERSTKHETNHFASKNMEIIVPEPGKHGYTVYNTVGTRQSSYFHSTKTGENFNYSEKGRGLNEGLTTLYTNQQLTELSAEKGKAAEQQAIYSHATELCAQLESIVGKDALKEAYYGGNLQGLEAKVDALAGEKGYESLRDCLDRTLSKDYAERVEAMKDAQAILAKMYEEGGKRT